MHNQKQTQKTLSQVLSEKIRKRVQEITPLSEEIILNRSERLPILEMHSQRAENVDEEKTYTFFIDLISEEQQIRKREKDQKFRISPLASFWLPVSNKLYDQYNDTGTALVGGWSVFLYLLAAKGPEAINWRGTKDLDAITQQRNTVEKCSKLLQIWGVQHRVSQSSAHNNKWTIDIYDVDGDIVEFPQGFQTDIYISDPNRLDIGAFKTEVWWGERDVSIEAGFSVNILSPISLTATKIYAGRPHDIGDIGRVYSALLIMGLEKEAQEQLEVGVEIVKRIARDRVENAREVLNNEFSKRIRLIKGQDKEMMRNYAAKLRTIL